MEVLAVVNGESNAGVIVIFAILTIICAVCVIGAAHDRAYFAVVILALMIGVLLFIIYTAATEEISPTYEVLIHDISEFDYERYEIIEQRGKIFVVKERIQ